MSASIAGCSLIDICQLPAEGKMSRVRKSPLLIISLAAALGATAIYLLPLPAVGRMSWPFVVVFAGLSLVQLFSAVLVLAEPTWTRLLFASAGALTVFALWVLVRLVGALPDPDPWIPVNSVIGFTDGVCAGLELMAAVGLAVVALGWTRPEGSLLGRILSWAGVTALSALVLMATTVGVIASSDGFAGAGFPGGTVAPQDLPAGQLSTVEYCRPDGVPLAMDLYTRPAENRDVEAAPVVMYVHGGGALGDRKTYGAGGELANHQGALFTPLQQRLNGLGFVVAAIDHRLPPATPWPAQIEDVKCAVRFLRAHAADLVIDPERIGVWGASGGGHLASLLGLTGPEDGFDVGLHLDQSSTVQAVVDMFGPTDLNDFDDAAPLGRLMARISFGSSTEVRAAASPINHVRPDAPSFLILHGTDDTTVVPRQSTRLARRLEAADVPTTLIEVQGAEHGLDTPSQRPNPEKLTSIIVDFFSTNLTSEAEVRGRSGPEATNMYPSSTS